MSSSAESSLSHVDLGSAVISISVALSQTAAHAVRPSIHTHTHAHPFNGPLSGTTRVGQYQKGKTNLDFTEARDSEW